MGGCECQPTAQPQPVEARQVQIEARGPVAAETAVLLLGGFVGVGWLVGWLVGLLVVCLCGDKWMGVCVHI